MDKCPYCKAAINAGMRSTHFMVCPTLSGTRNESEIAALKKVEGNLEGKIIEKKPKD